ncbi:TniQ family protein [Endozoicomonas sp. 8E]|uniref:TniQ family protein n=1 Tax=Endozoicomonas sp. 8E TaxID=3035692 RepID=UPI002938F5DE|nr:TniQ family protein [Endozoicomonas sp. 8E]WOG27391.1 TniQ family protein [Endozoicomonas sp. 8E]
MFLIRPDPEYDESLESYIIRLAEENHFRVKKLFPHLGKLLQKQHGKLAGAMPTDLGSFNLYHANTSSSKRYWALSLLSDLCCKEHLPFLELSVLKTDRLFAGHHSSLYWKGLDIPKVFFRSENIPVCPQCLKEKSYIPTFWHISLVRACPRHGTALVFKCPQCGVGADYIRDAAVHSCRCGFDLISAKTEIGNPQLVKLAERVYGYKTKSKGDNLLYSASTTEAVFGAVLWFMLWADDSGGPSVDEDDVLLRCIDFFDDWPRKLYVRLDQLAQGGLEYSVRSMQETAFRSIFGSLLRVSRYLPDSRLATNDILKFVFSFFDRAIFQEGHPYAEIGQTLLDGFEAFVILGINTRHLARLIEEGMLHPYRLQKDKQLISPEQPLFRLNDVFVLWCVSFQSGESNRSLYLSRW